MPFHFVIMYDGGGMSGGSGMYDGYWGLYDSGMGGK